MNRTARATPKAAYVHLRALRIAANLTQAEVASAVGVTVSQVSRWEAPEGPVPLLRHRRRLAKLYKVRLPELGARRLRCPHILHRKDYGSGAMRFTGFKTKTFFTLGIYVLFWHAGVVRWLRDEFRRPVVGQASWRLFIPIYNWVVWWQYLTLIRQIEASTYGSAEFTRGGRLLSVGRAFFWSGMWFSGGPYINRHLNGLDAFRRGQTASVLSTPALPPAPAYPPAANAG